ncbi:hypothetical protein H8K32_15435 [Undibacterium jejuense]|uniref:Uncharacterized protein n=1 Tax=Undibacterium jejuense TaxID=1344949 RepID=A0A923HFB7_9BURK|nr:hypothetical protein [Undibacterium jejuense]MBC3863497.1 hypothetical protein [Undibacterium jejuense]
MYESTVNKIYFRELFGSIAIYLVVLFTSVWIARDMQAGILRLLIALCPMIPVLFSLWAIVRHFRRIDEYLRQWSLENLAMAGGLTAIFSLTYGFMEGIGFPRLSMFVIWGIFMGGWGIIACLRKKLDA